MTTQSERPEELAPESAAASEATPTESTPEGGAAERPTPEAVASEPSPADAEAPVTEVVMEDEETSGPDADRAAMESAASDDARLQGLPKAGQRLEVKLVQIGGKEAFLDWGGPSEGTIAVTELKNAEGELRVQIGESFTAIVRKSEETVVFTVGRGKGGDLLRMREIQAAHEGEIPLPGKVKSTNKGGFEVDLNGVRAFCPFSQIDTVYCDTPDDHVGKEYAFQVIAFERGGRNIVLSRRKLVEAEAKERASTTRDTLSIGDVCKGVVRRLQPYGAFVDVGGIDGLVHVSEISRSHVANPRDVLKVGEEVEVKIIGIENLGTPKERISLSMKQLQSDPWDNAPAKWVPGSIVDGRVVRLTDFGAFVELAPGVDGLVHVSEISAERIGHPSEVLEPQQKVEVRILAVDPDSRRISLTLRPEGESPRERAPRAVSDEPRPPRRGGGRDRHREEELTHYTSRPEEQQEKVDVSSLEFDDALELLKRKFNQD